MTISAICTVNGSPIPVAGNGVTGVNVAGGSTITIALSNPAGVNNWEINCTNTDGYNIFSTVPLVQATKVQNFSNYTATFTMPAGYGFIGASVQFTSVVNLNGNGQNTVTFGVFVLNSNGSRLFFADENLESNVTYGVSYDLNELSGLVTNGGGGSGGIPNLAGDVTGTVSANSVVKIQGVAVSSTTPTTNQVLEYNGTQWAPATGGGGSSVTGSGLWHNTSGTLDAGANIGTAGQFAITKAGATDTGWASISGDVSDSATTVGQLTVTGIQTIAVPTPSGSSTVLTYNAGAFTWAAGGGGGGGFTALTGDVTASGSGSVAATVVSAQSGDILFNTTSINFANAVVNPSIVQNNKTTNSGVGNSLTLQAQNETGSASTGGMLVLSSGSGTNANGVILIQSGGTTELEITNNLVSIVPSTVEFTSTTAGPLISQALTSVNSATGAALTILAQIATGTSSVGGQLNLSSGSGTSSSGLVSLQVGGTQAIGISTTSATLAIPDVLFGSTVNSPVIAQNSTSVNSATGQTLIIQAQNAIGTTANGGSLSLTSGTGTSAAGNINLNCGASNILQLTSSDIFINVATVEFNTVSSVPVITQVTNSTGSATGKTFSIEAQSCSGSSSFGGSLSLGSGTGTTTAGDVLINCGATNQLTFSPGALFINQSIFQWQSGFSPTLEQISTGSANATGDQFSIFAQSATGTTSTGGAVVIKPGSGTSINGQTLLQAGSGNNVMIIGNAGIGLGSGTTPALTTGTVTLTAAQYQFPYLFFSGNLSGNVTIVFPGISQPGTQWYLDCTDVTLNGHTISISVNSQTWGTTLGTTDTYHVVVNVNGGFMGSALTP